MIFKIINVLFMSLVFVACSVEEFMVAAKNGYLGDVARILRGKDVKKGFISIL